LFKRGRRKKYGKLTFIYLASDERKTGFIASRDIRGAVRRNRVKRILREAYRMNRDYFKRKSTIIYAEGLITLREARESILKFKGGE